MKKRYIFILLILPVMLVFTAALLRYASGPYWISFYSDPEYVYLVKFLATAESKETLTTGHPGTTLQMLGAATVLIAHALDFSEKDNLEFAVLKNPEFYLNTINAVLVILNAIVLFVVGLITFGLTKNIWPSLLLQFSPFFSNTFLCKGLISVSPETLFLFSSMFFVMILVKMIFSNNLTKSMPWYVIYLAMICGFGIATKLTFSFLLIIPFIVLPKIRNKIVFLFLTIVCFLFWIGPIISQYKILCEWYYLVIAHSGYYGLGEREIINFTTYFRNIENIFLGNPLFCLIWLFSIYFIFRFRKSLADKLPYKLLMAVAVTELTAVLITSKHGYDYYLLPVLSLSGFTLFLILLCLQSIDYFNQQNRKKVFIFSCIFFVFCGLWRIVDIKKIYTQHMELKQESLMICQKLANEYKDYLEIIPLRASSALGALAFGNYFINNGLYSESLQKIYGEKYFYNALEGKFHTWTREFLIEDMFFKGKGCKIIFLSAASGKNVGMLINTGSFLHFESVLEGEYGSIYVLKDIIRGAGKFQKQSIAPRMP